MDAAVNFEGCLEKTASGIFRNVSHVWMVLNNLTLEYYKDKSKSDCIGSIDVHDIQIVRLTREKKGKEFQIITEDKPSTFVAESEELAATWVKVIQRAMCNKTLNIQSSQQSPIMDEIIPVIPKPTNIFGVTLKPIHVSRTSEHGKEASASKHEQSEQHKLSYIKSEQMSTVTFDLKDDNLAGFQTTTIEMSKYTASTEKDKTSSVQILTSNNNVDSSQKTFVGQTILEESISKPSYSEDVFKTPDAGASVISSTSQSTKLEAFESTEIVFQTKNSKSITQPPFSIPPSPLTSAVKITAGQSYEDKTVNVDFTNAPPLADLEKLKCEQTEIVDSSPIFPDLPSIQKEHTSLSVNDHIITANTNASLINKHEAILNDCKLNESKHDLKGDEIPNNLSEINNIPYDIVVHRKDETNVCKKAEQSAINNGTYEDVDISKLQMRNSKRFSATENRGCKVNDLSNISNNDTGGVEFRKVSKSLSTAGIPVDIINSRSIAHHTNYEPLEMLYSVEDDISPDISSTTHIYQSQISTFDNDLDSINSIPTKETDVNFRNANFNTVNFASFHRLQQYFKAMLPEEFEIENHSICSKNPVERLQSLLDKNYYHT